MNKYTAIGLLAAAAEGKRIIVLSPTPFSTSNASTDVHQVAPLLEWRRANGDDSVKLPSGGSIRFITQQQLFMRRYTADVVLVEDDRSLRDERLVDELRRAIHSSPDGEIVRY